jgi:hypothetical protein
MIRSIHTTPDAAAATQSAGGAQPTGVASFAEVHAAAVRASAASTSPTATTLASDETWKPIAGVNAYAKIASGPRTGQYVDLTRGAHHGDAFTIEQRDGKTVHVFKGSDGSEDVVDPVRTIGPKHAGARADAKPGKGETWGPVEGHSGYADILSGSRNGLYVNLSGGKREGQAFQLERRGDQELHIYGEGKHRRVIAMPIHHADKKHAAAKTDGGAKTPSASG